MSTNRRSAKGVREKIVVALIVVCAAFLLNSRGHSSAQWLPMSPRSARTLLANFSLSGLDGKTWRLEDHRGKVVLVNFWATWCPPCNAETPGLVRLANKYSVKGLDVVGVNMDLGQLSPVTRFVEEYHLPYPVLLPTANTPLPFSIEVLPTTLLLDRQGHIAKTYEGAVDESAFQADVERLIAER